MDVSTWLRDLGLANYVPVFRANDIDAEVLSRLTAEDLSAIGVTSVGHRRKLLDAIVALRGDAAGGAAEPIAATTRPVDAERRQLTVLFCDLVGSTELAARLDPEDLREVMGGYHRITAAAVERFEGHVARYLGDGVLAYFGWPRAHEDAAERAVRAGLELVGAVARLESHADVRLQARVGIATGQVVVGDLVGEGAARDEAVVGETPNLAARLQALAKPGTVVISQGTRRLVGGLFDLDDLGPQRLKGFAEPLAVWQVSGASRAEGRFEAGHTAGLTPLVGRDEELALLLRSWRRARDGEGQIVLLSGEPGIGKSRIVQEVRERLAHERHLRLTHQCSPYHQTSPLHPVIEQLERAAGFERDDPSEYSRALELCRQVGETPHLFPTMWGLWHFYLSQGACQTARELGDELLTLAEQRGDPMLLVAAHQAIGRSLYHLGDFAAALPHLEQARAGLERKLDPLPHLRYAVAPGVQCMATLGQLLWCLGCPDQALRRGREAVRSARELSHLNSLTFSMYFAIRLHLFRGELHEADELAESALALSTKHGFTFWTAMILFLRGWTRCLQGRGADGVAWMRAGFTDALATGAKTMRPAFCALLAEACGQAG
jgi:class 3 adenylate cyclase